MTLARPSSRAPGARGAAVRGRAPQWVGGALLALVLGAPAAAQSRDQLAPRAANGLHPVALPQRAEWPTVPEAWLWLPPNHQARATRYRTIVLLHGAPAVGRAAHPASQPPHHDDFQLARALDLLHAEGEFGDLAVVVVPTPVAPTALVEPAILEAWSTFTVHALLPAVAHALKAPPDAGPSAITGHAFGGFLALALAARHPEQFGAVYAMSPCCLLADEVERGPDAAPLTLDDALLGRLALLRAVGFDAGRDDEHRHIPAAIPVLDSLLTARRIPHFAELYTGDHASRLRDRLFSRVLPFLHEALARTP
jgi:enterochelin esterase-like enzyme